MNIETKKYRLICQLIKVNDEELLDVLKSILDFGLKQQINDNEIDKD